MLFMSSKTLRHLLAGCILSTASLTVLSAAETNQPKPATPPAIYNVRDFGATGDGKTLDTAAINKAIEGAAAAGGGTVRFPAGNYLSVSIHLKSNIALYLDQRATLIAASSADGVPYDSAEPNEWEILKDDARSPFILSDVKAADLRHIKAMRAGDTPSFLLNDVEDFSIQQSQPLPDTNIKKARRQQF